MSVALAIVPPLAVREANIRVPLARLGEDPVPQRVGQPLWNHHPGPNAAVCLHVLAARDDGFLVRVGDAQVNRHDLANLPGLTRRYRLLAKTGFFGVFSIHWQFPL